MTFYFEPMTRTNFEPMQCRNDDTNVILHTEPQKKVCTNRYSTAENVDYECEKNCYQFCNYNISLRGSRLNL